MAKFKQYFIVSIGTAMTSLAISMCYLPNKTVGGGISGISVILKYIAGIPPGASIGIINVLLLIISFFAFGRDFVLSSAYGSISLAVFTQVFSVFMPLTNNMLLTVIFGGILYGTGIGIVLAAGANTGGTDIVARLIQRVLPHISMGVILMFIDSFVILVSLIVFKDLDTMLYGILALVISSTSIDFVLKKLNVSVLAFVITEKSDDISELLIENSTRGITKISAIGAYSNKNYGLLICALKLRECSQFQKRILCVDRGAFIIYSESKQIVGNGFNVYK